MKTTRNSDMFDLGWWEQRQLLPVYDASELKSVHVSPSSDLSDIDRFRFISGESFNLQASTMDAITAGLMTLREQQLTNKERTSSSTSESASNDTFVPSSVVSLINKLIRDAVSQAASDIHFEPFDGSLMIRYRVDGSLREVQELGREVKAPAISRLKIMGGLDIAERRLPQDGRIRFHVNGKMVDIRLSTLPTDFGEKAVLRILDKSALNLDLKMLGMSESQLGMFHSNLHRTSGIILVTGPTGSGKTTTLYSALNEIHSPELNITTIEDPIEYNLTGVNQTQIKPEIGLDFAHVLRSVLRQDPNVIMVGEIRDSETLSIAIRAALTGHLVLSTVHTNDSVSTISRLLDLEAEPGLLASALRLIIAQRLVRVLCPQCKAEAVGDSSDDRFVAVGCDHCFGTGYSGRQAIFEFLEVDKLFAEAIETASHTAELSRLAQSAGLIDLRTSGKRLVESGITDSKQILREVS